MGHESPVLDYASPLQRPPRHRRWLWGFVALCAAGVLFTLCLPLFRTTGHSLYLNCLHNLRYITAGVIMYQHDHRGAYPPTLAETYPYLKNPRSYVCPASTDTPLPANTPKTQPAAGLLTPGACSYVYLGPTLPAKPSPPAILLHERGPSHNGKMCVAYSDGTARAVDANEAAYILSGLAAGHNPPRKR